MYNSKEALENLTYCVNGMESKEKYYKIIKQDLDRLEKLESQIKDGTLSDGYHTFNDLYCQRMYLFATIVNQNKELAWKSLKHEDGKLCFDGDWFIVGIDTPKGSYTYHYENKYWNLFDCQELEVAKHWDGHTDKDVSRLLSLPSENSKLKKAIEILNDSLELTLYHNKPLNTYSVELMCFEEHLGKHITKEEYELLKEVLK